MRKILLVLSVAALLVGLMASPLFAQWPNHKMHFPQLPDLIGWDVMATSNYPPPGVGMTLADDWQCSQTGPVTDIHFWGSWKNQDGIPGTDEFESPMPWFTLRIWTNNPGPPSTPATMLWEWSGEIQGVPSEPPTLESWYDPMQPIPLNVIYNDHIPYWRYDFILPPGYPAFTQQQGTIYWLSITANLFNPAAFQWGWKNSIDHFMDDAVWMGPTGQWIPLMEPPRYNIFHGYFDGQGHAWEDSMSTNFYGDGWYQYPSGWWNIWFYDNPFTPDHTKFIELVVTVTQFGPNPSIVFAVNYSSNLWEIPGRPPLPGDDESYIVRVIQPQVLIGDSTYVTLTIPYNPEWISIDVMATDVVVNGWVKHECVGTSMDLAFVITGPEEDIPTLNEWGMLILGLLLLTAGTIAVVRRRRRVPAET
jgi:hypothetical protein